MSTGTDTKQKRTTRIPALRHCHNRGFVELNGRRIYLGPWDAPETQEAYERTIAEWLENGRRLPVSPTEITVTEIANAYLQHAKAYYRGTDGKPTTSMDGVREAIKALKSLYGKTPAAEFGPLAVRNKWIDRKLSRKSVNYYTGHVKLLFKWAASHEQIPASTYHGLTTVENLRKGRSEAAEPTPIAPVPEDHVDKIKDRVPRQVWALIQLQLRTGARPGELVALRPVDIDTTGEVWHTRLAKHKTAYRGKTRVVHFGPKAQEVLRPFMLRPPEAYLFSPKEAEKERYAQDKTHRRPNQKPNPRKTDRKLGEHYTVDSYRRAIRRAIDEYNETVEEDDQIPAWSPHRLRHSAATRIRKDFGLEAAQVVLGHARADVTELYAEVNAELGAKIAKEVG